MKIAVLYHRDADGFGSAFAAHHALAATHDLLFESVQYGEPIPYEKLRSFSPDQVYILDFSYKAPDLAILMEEFNVVVIDHHRSAMEELKDFHEIHKVQRIDEDGIGPCTEKAHEDCDYCTSKGCLNPELPILPILSGVRVIQEQSGCMLAWAFFNPHQDPPDILCYVQDRDLWRFELESSKEINAYIATLPFDFEEWAEFYTPLAYDCGKAILAFQLRQIEGRVEEVEMVVYHHDRKNFPAPGTYPALYSDYSKSYVAQNVSSIPCVNASDNISELGDALCHAYPDAPFSMSYCDRPDGLRSYSLRSRFGFDVSEVAVAFGGGGHAGAAGFSLPSPAKI